MSYLTIATYSYRDCDYHPRATTKNIFAQTKDQLLEKAAAFAVSAEEDAADEQGSVAWSAIYEIQAQGAIDREALQQTSTWKKHKAEEEAERQAEEEAERSAQQAALDLRRQTYEQLKQEFEGETQ